MRLRFLLDTNILIPLQDSYIVLSGSIKNFIRLANVGGHQLLYHPASLEDIQRDSDTNRRDRTLPRLEQYELLEGSPPCPWNSSETSPNDSCDNQILYALKCNAAHALVTEDKGIHTKARARGLGDRVYNIQTAEDWLKRLHEPKEVQLPNIEDVPLYSLSPELDGEFFNSLRDDYDFDEWFQKKAKEGRRAWIYRNDDGFLGAICIYAVQENEVFNDAKDILQGKALKLCTLKVDEPVRGRKIGELFLKASFKYASENHCVSIFIHGDERKQPYLASILEDFGFFDKGGYGIDTVWVKQHPEVAPVEKVSPKEYVRRYFPHFRQDEEVAKYILPIRPEFHDILFPDYLSQSNKQMQLFSPPKRHVGNAIKLAYLCHAQTKEIASGSVLFFYRSKDEKMLTTIGVVDNFRTLSNPTEIAALVSRRTVYSFNEISNMSNKEVKVILFRLIKHFDLPISLKELISCGVMSAAPQSITKLDKSRYWKLKNATKI